MSKCLSVVSRTTLLLVATAAATVAFAGPASAKTPAASDTVTVPSGEAIQIGVAVAMSGEHALLGASGLRAVQMAVEGETVGGFPVALNVFDAPCTHPLTKGQSKEANRSVAAQIAGNPQTAAAIGHTCSYGTYWALPSYESAGMVVVTPTATAPDLNAQAPTMFNRTVVHDGHDGEAWYETIRTLPGNIAWQQDYEIRWGTPPAIYADLHYDAAKLLIARIRQVATTDAAGNLVIPRAALATAVRQTTDFEGVSCTITLDAQGNRVNDPLAVSACA